MIPLASVSWEVASESDGTPDQNNGLFCPLTLIIHYRGDIEVLQGVLKRLGYDNG